MAANPKATPRTQGRFMLRTEHPQVTATTTVKCFKAPRALIIDSVRYINPTGLAEDTTNAFAGVVKKGSTTFATLFDTDSDGAGDNNLAANTWVDGSLDADSTKRTLDAGDECNLVLTEAGTATLPAGALVVEGRFLS